MTFDRNADITPARAMLTWLMQSVVTVGAVGVAITTVRGCRRAGAVTLDAALATGFALSFWQDQILNYAASTARYSHYAVHAPGLGPYIPGWHGPAPDRLIMTVLGSSGLAWFVLMLLVWPLAAVVIRAARRWPTWGTARLFLVCLAAGLVVSFVSEETMIFIGGLYSWTGAIHSLSIFGGHWYQLPITELISFSVFLSLPAMMLYKLRIHGTIPPIFRGLELFGPHSANWTRLLAGIGYGNVLTLGYLLFNAFIAYIGGPVPTDLPAYLR
ncbi:spirocyclase AveC family protein [Streptomyces olivoreticuli]|uniref:spirocyclase AveC family protein n=1 Tax=Streptomyces olivoreticuli TaxID=68246 RepID=UPI002658C8DB|nr:spirocyclase AveC family protein [Streptomyces olivoreticuli]WKK23952.1 spirocyclase AveC family protein [Streptomyces olivoreticuli]